jgi:hypothetical protein
LDFWRAFQMPIFGYTGFLPFALEVFALFQVLLFLEKKTRSRIFLRTVILVALICTYAGAFFLIDTFTLK